MIRFSLALFALVLPASVAGAQEPAPDPAAVAARVPEERRCVAALATELGHWSRLLADLEGQLARATAATHRTELAGSIVVVEGRLRDVANALGECVPPAPAAVATEDEPPPPPPLRAISENLRVDPPSERGPGHLEGEAIHRALSPFGQAFEVCYDQLADRHAIVRGTAALRFEVRADGTVVAPRFDRFSLGDGAFQRCVQEALPRITSPGRPRGGAVTVDLMLTIGPTS